MIELLQSIPAKARQAVYFGYGLLVFTLGAIHVGLVAAAVTKDPTWLVVADEVVQYASIPIAAVAGVNVTTASVPQPAPSWPDQEVDSGDDARTVAATVQGKHKAKMVVPPGKIRQVPPLPPASPEE